MTEPITVISHDLEQTLAIGRTVSALAQPGDTIALVGELGAGKTQFVRGLAEGLGIAPEAVSSPTFVIMHEYEAAKMPDATASANHVSLLVHIDAYRLNSSEELDGLGLDDVRNEAVLAVEWADRVLSGLGEDVLMVEITHDPAGRRFAIMPRGRWVDKIQELVL